MADLSDRTAIVTGAASGIGSAIAERLGADGAHVVVVDVSDGSETVDSVEDAGGSAEYREGDVTDESSMAAALSDFDIDVLVNNAAYYAPLVGDKKRFTDIEADEWDTVMDVNAKGVFIASKQALPYFRDGGSIVNISSTTALSGTAGFMHYVASKAAVLGMTRVMATELGDRGIRANAVAPGFTASEASKQAGAAYLDARVEKQALDRSAQPTDIADAVAFLSGPNSDMITGQVLTVDGGKTMY